MDEQNQTNRSENNQGQDARKFTTINVHGTNSLKSRRSFFRYAFGWFFHNPAGHVSGHFIWKSQIFRRGINRNF